MFRISKDKRGKRDKAGFKDGDCLVIISSKQALFVGGLQAEAGTALSLFSAQVFFFINTKRKLIHHAHPEFSESEDIWRRQQWEA